MSALPNFKYRTLTSVYLNVASFGPRVVKSLEFTEATVEKLPNLTDVLVGENIRT